MALITCPECGQKISSQANNCPHCGAPAKKVATAGCPVWLAIVFLAFVVVLFIIGHCSNQSSSPTPTRNESPLTLSEANHINIFARKHDMTVEQVMRWEYVLSQHGFNLSDYDQALTRLEDSADKALGYHVVRPKENLGTRLVNEGELRSSQDANLTSDEKSILKVLDRMRELGLLE
jgi:hypothetical protein